MPPERLQFSGETIAHVHALKALGDSWQAIAHALAIYENVYVSAGTLRERSREWGVPRDYRCRGFHTKAKAKA